MRLRQIFSLVFAGFPCIAYSGAAQGQDFLVTASGPLATVQSEAKAFDGTNTTTLPDILDLGRLQGGSFRATYRFTPVTPEPSGTDAIYELSPTSGMISYELLDANGVVVHRGSNPSGPVALLENNSGSPPFSVDQVILTSGVDSVTGLHVPTALYSQTPDFSSGADFNVNGYVGNGVEYLNDLSIPTDAATYLAFPTAAAGRAFDVFINFGDGDYQGRVKPYQFANATLQYDITAVDVAQVPEPFGPSLLVIAGLALLGQRGGRTRR